MSRRVRPVAAAGFALLLALCCTPTASADGFVDHPLPERPINDFPVPSAPVVVRGADGSITVTSSLVSLDPAKWTASYLARATDLASGAVLDLPLDGVTPRTVFVCPRASACDIRVRYILNHGIFLSAWSAPTRVTSVATLTHSRPETDLPGRLWLISSINVTSVSSVSGYETRLVGLNPSGSFPIRMTSPLPTRDSLRLSPDGTRLAVEDSASKSLFIQGLNGQGRRRLIDGESPAWSPDGRRLAFIRYNQTRTESHVWIINADGSAARQLTKSRQNEQQPSWAPDGSLVAYVGIDIRHQETWVVKPDGKQPRVLRQFVQGPTWSPDSRQLAVIGAGKTNNCIGLLSRDGNLLRALPACGRVGSLAWSPDGRTLAYTDFDAYAKSGTDGVYQATYIVSTAGTSPPVLVSGGSVLAWQPAS